MPCPKTFLILLMVLALIGLACVGTASPPAARSASTLAVTLTRTAPTRPPAPPNKTQPTPFIPQPSPSPSAENSSSSELSATPIPTLPAGFYRAQSGDTLAGLVARWHVVTDTLLALNPGLPITQTLTPGMVLDLSGVNWPVGGYAGHLLPDSEVVFSPSAEPFDLRRFVLAQPGFLATYTETLDTDPPGSPPRAGWDIVEQYARSYSIHPRLLLALLEYQGRALSDPRPADFTRQYPLGAYSTQMLPGLSHQLGWVCGQLNSGYYGWRAGVMLTAFNISGVAFPVSPTLNAGSFAVVWALAQLYDQRDFAPDQFAATYRRLFGDPFALAIDVIPGQLAQPEFQLPFEPGKTWALTGGPHPGYGHSLPFGALDFAPPIAQSGCVTSTEWVTAVHSGTVVYSGEGQVELDLGNGWTVVYLHIATMDRIPRGVRVNAGDQLGHPSCEGGTATGTSVHLARKYNGEWIPADGFAPFEMSGWVTHAGPRAYEGFLTRGSQTVSACSCANGTTLIRLGP